MENTGTHTFQLPDASGGMHDYFVLEHPAGEGMEIMYGLLALGAPTVLGLAGAALASEQVVAAVVAAFTDDKAELDVVGLLQMAAGIDLSKVGAELGQSLGTGRAPELTRKVLSKAHRDGQPLKNDAQFGLAYQANYAELLAAVWRVCSINRFFPVPSTSLDGSNEPKKTALPSASPTDS